MKKNKKVDVKKIAKGDIMGMVEQALVAAGYELSSGEPYGMSEHTLVVHLPACDVQLKAITPKAGLSRYEAIPDDED